MEIGKMLESIKLPLIVFLLLGVIIVVLNWAKVPLGAVGSVIILSLYLWIGYRSITKYDFSILTAGLCGVMVGVLYSIVMGILTSHFDFSNSASAFASVFLGIIVIIYMIVLAGIMGFILSSIGAMITKYSKRFTDTKVRYTFLAVCMIIVIIISYYIMFQYVSATKSSFETSNATRCEQMTVAVIQADCYWDLAIKTSNITYCDYIDPTVENGDDKKFCEAVVSRKLEKCDLISGNTQKTFCKALLIKNKVLCDTLEIKTGCYYIYEEYSPYIP